MPSRNRRVRLVASLAIGIFLIWMWSGNAAIVDVYRQHGSAEKAVGGGSVLRPDLQRPEMHEPPHGGSSDLDSQHVGGHRDSSDRESPKDTNLHDIPEQPSPETPSTDDLLHSEPAINHQEPVDSPTTTTSTTTAPTPSSKPAALKASVPPPANAIGDNPYGFGRGRLEISVDPSTTTTAVHWSKMPEHFPISSTIQLPAGTSKPFPRIQREINKLSMYGADEEKLKAVKEAADHTWKGYKLFAFGHDEVKPVSHMTSDPFMGWGATLVDSLDTLYVMGMEKEFEEAVEAVAKIDFTTSPRSDIPLFETTIRYLGGLLAAYDVSGKKHRVLLDKAVELAEVLYGAFDTPNRAPIPYYRWKPWNAAQPKRASGHVILAELGTLSLEFTRLAQLTYEPKYYDAIARLTDLFEEWQNSTRLPGMWPTYFDASGCGPVLPPSTTTKQQEPLPVSPGDVVSEDLQGQGQPGPLGDDGTGVHEAEDVFFNEESHGNTWKRKRQFEEGSASLSGGEIVENDLQNDKNSTTHDDNSSDPELVGHVVENTDNAAHPEHELRAPPEVIAGNISPPVRDDDDCSPQGFVSASHASGEGYTLSGMSDSMYEYLPKEYILLGGQVEKYRTMYLDSAEAAIKKLLYKPMTIDERDILLSGDLKIVPNYSQPFSEREYIEKFTPEVAHLACFAGGMFAMAGVIFDEPEHVKIGSKLTDGCVWAYNVTATGIMPEGALLMPCWDTWGECKWNETEYFEVLDPYADSRTETVPPAIPQSNPGNPEPIREAEAEYAARRTGAGSRAHRTESEDVNTGILSEHGHDEARDSHSGLNKRQLEALDEDDLGTPPPPTPAGEPDPPPSHSVPLYTPPTPLSHEEYVKNKMEEEGLPPGFIHINSRKYILRPEAIESVFYMYRITGDPYWREVGWNMFTSIEKHTRAPFGHSAIDDVASEFPEQTDSMESFWMAETLKYFYLLYDDPANWSLDEWVLNTEAHLFRRPPFDFA